MPLDHWLVNVIVTLYAVLACVKVWKLTPELFPGCLSCDVFGFYFDQHFPLSYF